MRSRYSAFVLGLSDYLASSWAPETRPAGPLATEPDRKWLGLKVIAVAVADNGQTGSVEFIARSRVAGKGVRLHEKSRFRLSGNGWLYIDGETDA